MGDLVPLRRGGSVVQLVRREATPLTRVELAQELGVSARTVDRWIAQGCPSERWGRHLVRFVLPDVRKWLREGGGIGS